MKRKIIQLMMRQNLLIALCDDGTMWSLEEKGQNKGAYFEITSREWVPSYLPAIPQRKG